MFVTGMVAGGGNLLETFVGLHYNPKMPVLNVKSAPKM